MSSETQFKRFGDWNSCPAIRGPVLHIKVHRVIKKESPWFAGLYFMK
jgi:hypothetical protein